MEFQHAYSKPFRGSDLECKDESLAQQHFKDDTDINVLLERFKITGQLPQGVVLPTYGDFTGVSDYRSAMEAVRKANNAFMELPAEIRNRFQNDPQRLLEFVSDDKNREEAEKLGLVPVRAKPEAAGVSGAPAPDVNGSQVVTGSGAL